MKRTRLSSLLATVAAKRRSPASSEMRKRYSGADTWFERCVRPAREETLTSREPNQTSRTQRPTNSNFPSRCSEDTKKRTKVSIVFASTAR